MYEIPYSSNGKSGAFDPCPLSSRELDVLKKLAEGKVYKQIAVELELSTSTVRTHLHNTFTPSSGPATALRPCCWPPTAAGSESIAGSVAPPSARPRRR